MTVPAAPPDPQAYPQIIPNANVRQLNVGSGVISVADKLGINRTAQSAQQRQITVAALDSIIPIPYGQVRLGALLANAIVDSSGHWVFWLIWGLGPIEQIVSITMDDAGVPAGTIATHYLGASGQGVDSTLSAAFPQRLAAGSPTFAETCPGLAYSVLRIPAASLSGPPQFNAVIKGRRVYDPRLDSTNGGSGTQRLADASTWAWSRNPALILADFLYSSDYGDGHPPDWSTVITVANACDATVGGETKRLADLVVDREASTRDWLESMRTAAGCWLVPQGNTVKLIADVSASSVASYSHAAGNVLGVDSETLAATNQLPTVVEVIYTDTTVTPWRDMSIFAKRPGVDAGTTPYRKATVRMPWVTRATQANREAIEWINKLWLRSVSMNVQLMDEGLKHEPGDVIDLTWPDSGYSALLLRVLNVTPTADGWTLKCTKEDPGAYSDSVQAGPTIPTTTMPSPNDPPAVSGLSVVEDVYQVQTGLYGSRLSITWTDAAWPFTAGYQVTVYQEGVAKDGPVLVPGTSYVTKQLTENLLYQVDVALVSTTGTVGTPTTATITNNGKQAKPSDVPAITGFEVGGEVRLNWTAATDLDLTAYEIRYGATGGSWSTATLLDRVATPSLRYNTKVVPSGTWRFWIKALDSVRSTAYPFGQESVNAVYCDLTVTSDANAFVAADYDFASPSLFNFTALADGSYISDYGGIWNTIFSSTLASYTNPLDTYSGTGTSLLATEVYDAGVSLTGDWYGAITYTNLSGAANTFLDVVAAPEGNVTVTGATNATPIVVTATAHGYSTGDEVVIAGVAGNTAANGRWKITKIDANTFSVQTLNGANVAGNGAYTSGGTANRWPWQSFSSLTAKGTFRYARVRLTTTGVAEVTGLGSITVNSVARRESSVSPVTTLASGPLTITLANHYTKAKAISANAIGTTAATLVYDSVEVSGNRGILTGTALRFDGANAYVTMGNQTIYTFGNGTTDSDFCVEFWLRPDTISVAQALVAKSNDGVTGEWGVVIDPSGALKFSVVDNSVPARKEWIVNARLVVGVWQHIAASYNGSTQTATVYVDGVAVATTASTTGAYVAMESTTNPLMVGRQNAGNFADGVIDEVRLWSTQRTQAQIAANKDAEISGASTGLVGYWKFDEATGTTAADSTANAHAGTLSGATLPKWRPYDGFDLYAFNASGTQIAQQATWTFDGV